MEAVNLGIGEMVCVQCVGSVRRILERLPGVVVEEVAIGSARVRLDPARTTAAQAAAALERAGFPATVRGAAAVRADGA